MTKKLRPLALALLLLFPCAALAEVKIPAECRMKNRPPGRCGWCALETLARHQHIKALYGLVEDCDCRCDVVDLEELLRQKGITYELQPRGPQDTAILHRAMKDNHGVVVGFRELFPGSGGHIVTLVDIDDDNVRVLDSNDQDGRMRTMPLERFLYWWDGFALVLHKKPAKR